MGRNPYYHAENSNPSLNIIRKESQIFRKQIRQRIEREKKYKGRSMKEKAKKEQNVKV